MLATLFAAGACGPSLRRVHRSEVYFERCYAADFDARVPIEERRACWQAWMAHWQVGQPPDRIDYVRERLLRLDPERAAIVALATGGADADPVPLTDTQPAIAAEARSVAEVMGRERGERGAVEASGGEGSSGGQPPTPAEGDASAGEMITPAEIAGPAPVIAAGSDREPAVAVGDPEPAPRTVPPARERRRARTPVMPLAEERPHCAEACRPGWEDCARRCGEAGVDRFACLRACRLSLQACSRACY